MVFSNADAAFAMSSSIIKNVSVEMQATEIDERGVLLVFGFSYFGSLVKTGSCGSQAPSQEVVAFDPTAVRGLD